MASTQTRQWGVTPPISLSLPSDAEIDTNDALVAELKQQNNFETSDETEKRYVRLVL
jgi:poly(A) polymerase